MVNVFVDGDEVKNDFFCCIDWGDCQYGDRVSIYTDDAAQFVAYYVSHSKRGVNLTVSVDELWSL